MQGITITVSSPDVKLVEGKALLAVSVSNNAPSAQRIVLAAFEVSDIPSSSHTQSPWARIDRPLRTIEPLVTEQYEVEFDTTGAAAGTHSVRLIAYSADDAPEELSGNTFVVKLLVESAPIVPPTPFPWWIVGVGVVVLLLFGGLGWFLLMRDREATLTGVVVNPSSLSVLVGNTSQLSATGTFSDGSRHPLSAVDWKSNDPEIVHVAEDGVVTGLKIGTASVTAAQGGVTAVVSVKVATVVLERISVSPASAEVLEEKTVQLRAEGQFSDGSTKLLDSAFWSVDVPGLASVDSAGLVTGRSPGSVVVTASTAGVEGAARISVTPAVLTAISIETAQNKVVAGRTTTLRAIGVFNNGSRRQLDNLSWVSEDSSRAKVDGAGVVTGLLPGAVAITASVDGTKGSAVISVLPAVLERIMLTPDSAVIGQGKTKKLGARGYYSDLSSKQIEPTWRSDNPPIAGVSNTGVVNGKDIGKATIWASLDGIQASAEITVEFICPPQVPRCQVP